jgi:succinyl-CoA synthetase beta subunit
MVLTEKEAESFLGRNGFVVVEGAFVKHSDELLKSVNRLGFPLVMKASGKNIVHKKKIGGVKLNINSYGAALRSYKELKAVKGFEGVILQKQISGKEVLLGLKKTPEFGHVLAFGSGGSDAEQIKDVSFRVCPLDKNDFYEIIKDTKISKILNNHEKETLVEVLKKLSGLSLKFPKISELDINPLFIKDKIYYVADARIVF